MLKLASNIASLIVVAANACALLPACGARTEDTGTETHWLKICDSDADCNGPTSCLCGVCTIECEGDDSCPEQAPVCSSSGEDSCYGGLESICLSANGSTDGYAVTGEQGLDRGTRLYVEAMCNYDTLCVPARFQRYASSEQCVEFMQAAYTRYSEFRRYVSPVWDVGCLGELTNLACPQGSQTEDALAADQYFSAALKECANPQLLGCNDDDDCFGVGECSAPEGSCGSCEPFSPGTCRFSFDCSGGDSCVDGVCGQGKPVGSTCVSTDECESRRCSDTCVDAQPLGGSCTETRDCELYLWCDQGACRVKAAAGQSCGETQEDVEMSERCQRGYFCFEERCREYELGEIPVGEVCLLPSSCALGAECVDHICVESDNQCVQDDQCPKGQYCDAQCLPQLRNGEDCVRDRSCLSGYCSEDNVCADANPCD